MNDIFYTSDAGFYYYNEDNERIRITVEYLLSVHIMFSNTLDLKLIRMYISMGYTVIFKYENHFICISLYKELNGYNYTKKEGFLQIFQKVKVCSKQDIKNYCHFVNNSNIAAFSIQSIIKHKFLVYSAYPINVEIFYLPIESEMFNEQIYYD